MIAIPKMDKLKSCTECPFEVIGISGYPRCVIMQEMVVDGNPFNRCPLIDIVPCRECKHRDPEDKKCDCGMFERQGCIFPVADDYFCKYGERRE